MNETQQEPSAIEKTFNTPELLEHILIYLLEELYPKIDHEDPRSERTKFNASTLLHLVRCSEVNKTWHKCIFHGSKPMRRALFLLSDLSATRSWQLARPWYDSQHDYHHDMEFRAPVLNPIIRAIFPLYRFRLWRAAVEASGPKHRAYIIVSRKDAKAAREKAKIGQGRTISRMLLSRPPTCKMSGEVWERKDTEAVGERKLFHTRELGRPVVECTEGITLGLLHERVWEMFSEHPDVEALKITTI